MRYDLGVDFGTTYTAAAVHRDARTEIVTLGGRAAAVPSVLYLTGDFAVVAGEAAERRGASDSERLTRHFKRRIGDPTPVVVGGAPYSAEALTAKLLRWVVETVTEREAGPPQRLALSHPANWGPYKQEILRQAVRMAGLGAGLGEALMLTEPEAAAIAYASAERVDPGSLLAVYDLGGGTFDAAVLRKTGLEVGGRADSHGFEILGVPEGIEHLGGVDFDEAVLAHVDHALGGVLATVDLTDPSALAAVTRLRQECVDAKEALSTDTEVSVPVLLPDLRTQVRLVRSEFEAMIRPALDETIAALRRALRSAQVAPPEVSAVLLVGGSSRIPLVAQMVSAELGRPVAVDAHPKHAIALGAALAAAIGTAAPVAPPAPVEPLQPPVTPGQAIDPPPVTPGQAIGPPADPARSDRANSAIAPVRPGRRRARQPSPPRRKPSPTPPPTPPAAPKAAPPDPAAPPGSPQAGSAPFLPPVTGGAAPQRRRDRRILGIAVAIGVLLVAVFLIFRSLGPASAATLDHWDSRGPTALVEPRTFRI